MKRFENILVAFDLNKTLFFKCDTPLPRKHDKKIKRLHLYIRPHLQQLVEYLHYNQINYCFWSNMLGRNCVKYVKQLQTLGMSKHCGIFDQDFCDKGQNLSLPGQIVKSIKDLNKLAKTFQIDVDCCVLVDDSQQKNVEGCNLIQVRPYKGQQDDDQILIVIQKLKSFRKTRLDEQQKNIPMLRYTQYRYSQQLSMQVQIKEVQIVQKVHQPTQLEIEIENNPQLKKLKADLVLEKQARKCVAGQILNLQKSIADQAEQIKKQSEGKLVKKGDQLLVQVLLFAKNKKVTQKKMMQFQQKKKMSEQKISIIKKLMRSIIQKLDIHVDQEKRIETNAKTSQGYRPEQKKDSAVNSKESGQFAERKEVQNLGKKEE